jgi:nitrous oxide reductase accessory protein NosL
MKAKKIVLCAFMTALLFALPAGAGEKKPVALTAKDKCPVCGMFTAKYPEWASQIIFTDGSYATFDGPKDMVKYYLAMKKYNPSKSPGDVDSVYVKDYYSLSFIEARKAYFVEGSDIYGPMGRELVPFEKEADAKVFLKDHKGKRVLTFKEITPETVKVP